MEIFVKFVIFPIYHLSICDKNKCTSLVCAERLVLVKNRSNDLVERILMTHNIMKIKCHWRRRG